jgi:hypothetical protein
LRVSLAEHAELAIAFTNGEGAQMWKHAIRQSVFGDEVDVAEDGTDRVAFGRISCQADACLKLLQSWRRSNASIGLCCQRADMISDFLVSLNALRAILSSRESTTAHLLANVGAKLIAPWSLLVRADLRKETKSRE